MNTTQRAKIAFEKEKLQKVRNNKNPNPNKTLKEKRQFEQLRLKEAYKRGILRPTIEQDTNEITYKIKACGAQFTGRGFLTQLKKLKVKSILDVGAGKGHFKEAIRKKIKCVSVDIASTKSIDIQAPAHKIPVADNSFEFITAFDVLEHLIPEEINEVLKEFKRIATRGWIFKIAYDFSGEYCLGHDMHLSVYPETWWIHKLEKYIFVNRYQDTLYRKNYLWGCFI